VEATNVLYLSPSCPLKAQNAGLFVSRGGAMHPVRILDSHELIFVKQGELDMWEGEQVFHLEAGQTLHLWPGRQHGSTGPMPPGLKFYWIHFEVEGENGREELRSGNGFAPVIRMPQVARIAQPERLERLFRVFLEDQETGMLHPYSANLLTTLMLIEVGQATEERAGNPDEAHALASWAHAYIRLNYDRPISTSKVAAALGYNADYLGRVYHKVYGHSLTEAINRRRVSVACDYLLDSNLTIEQIAQKCGFADPDYFRRVFRRYMHISPAAYRKEYSRVHINTH
jgi:AraC-like DNA-binding protein